MSFLTVFFQSSEILILYLEEHVSDKNSKILLRNLTSTKSYLIMWNSWWWSQVRLWPRGDHHGPHPDPGWVPTPPLSAAQLPLGWGFWGLGSRDSTHLNLKGPKPQGSCSSNLRPGSTPEGNENHWAAGNHRFNQTWSDSSPTICSPSSYQAKDCQHTLRQDTAFVHIKPAIPPKSQGTCRLQRDTPT